MHYVRYSVSHQSNAMEDRWHAIDPTALLLLTAKTHVTAFHYSAYQPSFNKKLKKKLTYFSSLSQISLPNFRLKSQILGVNRSSG